MHPIICQIGPFTIYSYGVMLAISVIVCSVLLAREAVHYKIHPDTIYDLVFWIILSGIIGARMFYVLLNIKFFIENPREIIMVQHGGLAWQGSLLVGTVVGIWLIKRERLPFLLTLDLMAPYIALGQAIGRVGCFLNGCCYGKEVSWGIYFPVHGARLHPTQLYMAGALLAIFFILKKFRTFSKIPGQVLVYYFILASGQRFIVEFFRADHEILWMGLSIFQLVSLIIFFLAIVVNIIMTQRSS